MTVIVNKSFVMFIYLITSGFLLCAAYQLSDKEAEQYIKFRGSDEDIKVFHRAVGIHLGNTYSSISVFKPPVPNKRFCFRWPQGCAMSPISDTIEFVKNERGSTTTPSCVAFTDTGVLIGELAKDQAHLNPQRTICGINRLIGKGFDDRDVQTYIKTLPYKVVNKENKPHVEVKFENGDIRFFSPEEICAIILGKMKQIAEAFMGTQIEHASVLVHPSYFDYEEVKQAITEAGKLVGLKVVYVGKSGLAAVLTRHSLWEWDEENSRVLVYNLGGSAFDVSVVDYSIEHKVYYVNMSRGDVHFGGQAFDTRVLDYLVNVVKNKYKKDISKDSSALAKLSTESEKAKISLSNTDRVLIKIDSLSDGISLFEETLTRSTFEDLNMDLFNKTIDLVRDVVNELGGIEKSGIDKIVLVGGNTQIPKIQLMLKEFLDKEHLKEAYPDEALAFASTHIAGILSGATKRISRILYMSLLYLKQ